MSRTVLGTRQDAGVALARPKVADHEKRLAGGGTRARSVQAAFQMYLDGVESGLIEVAPARVVTTRSAAKRMGAVETGDGKRFGDIPVSRLSWKDIEELYAGMKALGHGSAWVRRCATVLARALELARKRGLIDANPAKDATRPRTVRSKPFAPTSAEVRAVLAFVRKTNAETADLATVVASTGMRKGEVLALRWCDIDLGCPEAHVAAAITDGGPGVGVLRKSTKGSDWRDVPLTERAAAALRSQWGRRRQLLDVDPSPEDYVFPASVEGRVPLRPDALSGRWVAARGASEITMQHLRHYAATAMLDAGESYRTVADILGNTVTARGTAAMEGRRPLASRRSRVSRRMAGGQRCRSLPRSPAATSHVTGREQTAPPETTGAVERFRAREPGLHREVPMCDNETAPSSRTEGEPS